MRLYDPTIGRFISPDRITNVADPQQINGYTYADNNPTTNSDPTGLDPGRVSAHRTAIMLRLAALQAKYPNAVIWGSTKNEHGADLVCWGCAPGEVWVWEFKSENTRRGERALNEEVQLHMLQVAQDPLSAGMVVVPGPTFASLGLPPIQVGSNFQNSRQLVTVHDYDKGMQYYGTDQQKQRDPAFAKNRAITVHARAVSDRAKAKAAKARAGAQSGPSRKRKTGSPAPGGPASPPAVVVPAWTAADDHREAARAWHENGPFWYPPTGALDPCDLSAYLGPCAYDPFWGPGFGDGRRAPGRVPEKAPGCAPEGFRIPLTRVPILLW